MTKTTQNFVFFFLIIVSVLLFFLNKYNDKVKKNQIDILVSNTIKFIHNEISYQKDYALSLSILFSKNQKIIHSLQNNEPKKLQKELKSLLDSLSKYTQEQNIQIQVHTKELKVFVRSWEDKDKGLDLSTFRKGLVKVEKTKQPYVSNELGQRLNIKAISPIFNKEHYIGSLEIIINYESLKKHLSTVGIETIALLDQSFLPIAKNLQNNTRFLEYVISEKNYNQNLYEKLLHHQELFNEKQLYYEIDDEVITFIAIGNRDERSVGYLVACFKNRQQSFDYLPNYQYKGSINDTLMIQETQHDRKKIIIK